MLETLAGENKLIYLKGLVIKRASLFVCDCNEKNLIFKDFFVLFNNNKQFSKDKVQIDSNNDQL